VQESWVATANHPYKELLWLMVKDKKNKRGRSSKPKSPGNMKRLDQSGQRSASQS